MTKIGKIKSVYCKNFVTYNECVFNPSEYLNVIIGPNGTGKSTLVSAVVLALGGDPKILARSSSIADYVKNGCESATVSVELYDSDNDIDCKYTKFERKFQLSDAKSQFRINDQNVNQKEYLKKVALYKIQISNLCQFLPQDRVQDFAKMNPQEILLNTISSVCSADVLENFKKMIELRKEQDCGKSSYKSLSQKLEETLLRVEELKQQLERFNARKEIEDKLNVCNAKKLLIDIEEISSKIAEYENDLALAKTSLANYEKEYTTYMQKQAQIDNKTSKYKKEIEQKDRNWKEADNKKAAVINKMDQLKKRMNEEKLKFEKRKRDWSERQNEIKNETKMLELFAEDLGNLKADDISDAERQRRILAIDTKLEELKSEIKRLMQDLRDNNNKLDDLVPELQSIKRRVDALENITEQRMKSLQSHFPDVYAATRWIEENRQLFEGHVYRPMIIELNVRYPQYAKYLENTINIKDLLSFCCESKNDLSLLATELCTKRKLAINIGHTPSRDMSEFRPKIPIQNIRKFGFDGYLIDLVSGPPAILAYLCSLNRLHNIPYGGESVKNFTDEIPSELNYYFGGDLVYSSSISKYSHERSLMQKGIKSKSLLSSKNESEITESKTRLNELTRKSDQLKNNRTGIESKIRELEVRHKEESLSKKELNNKAIEIQQKLAQIKRQQQKISALKAEINGIPEMEAEFKLTSTKILKEIIKLQISKYDSIDLYQKALFHKEYALSKMVIFKQENEQLMRQIAAAREHKDSAKKTVDVISNKCTEFKRVIKSKTNEARSLTNNMDPNDRNYPNRAFFQTLPGNQEDLREIISDFSGRLDCMDNVNPEVVREYDSKKNEVENLKKSIETNLQGHENYSADILNIFGSWYPVVTKVVFTINQHFGEFMESMGYVGEVKLINKEQFDFESYGIEILVQYRRNVPLQALNRHVQSGGERAVAIAVYTLSMQHITNVPFRCVDEINQGMDARNERKIFEMLVDETTKDDRSQYFFVTPKLLRNLKTNPRMSVHIVYNGRMVEAQNAFTLVI